MCFPSYNGKRCRSTLLRFIFFVGSVGPQQTESRRRWRIADQQVLDFGKEGVAATSLKGLLHRRSPSPSFRGISVPIKCPQELSIFA